VGNIAAVRTGLKTALAGIDGLDAYDYEPMMFPRNAAVVRMPDTIDLRTTFGGGEWEYVISVTVFVGLGDTRAADDQLEAYLAQTGSDSIIAALLVDPTLGGACASLDPMRATNFGYRVVGTDSYLSCDIELSVMT
jgi:hypothetical protein